MPSSIAAYIQELDLPPIVELFIITYRGETYYFTNTVRLEEIWWGGHKFLPLPLQLSGVGYTEDNQSEKPRLSLSNIGADFTTAFNGIPEIKGGKLDYIVTFLNYIRTSSTSNTTLFISKNYLTFARQVERIPDKHIIYELDPINVSTGKKFPPRQILREGKLNFRFEGAGLYKE